MRTRKPIRSESGIGQLLVAGQSQNVSYRLIEWGTFEGDTLCVKELHGYLEGDPNWPSGSAELTLQDGWSARILLRKSGSFAMCASARPPV